MYERVKARLWEGIENGVFQPWTNKEINTLLKEVMFGFEPIQELNPRDKEVISSAMKETLFYSLNREMYHQLSSDKVYFFTAPEELPKGIEKISSKRDYTPFFFVPPIFNPKLPKFFEGYKERFGMVTESLTNAGVDPISVEGKKTLLSDPAIWLDANCIGVNLSQISLVGYGMRHLRCYGITDEQFLETVQRIQNATRKDKINLLDVGGANGLALNDARSLTNAVVTHNLTPTVEPVMFKTDFIYTCLAERMPLSLNENMDLIISNMAFAYIAGQHLALENILQSLSVGGEADLSVEWGKQDAFVDNFSQRMAQQYKKMKDLHDSGHIELNISSGYDPHPLDFPISKDNFYPSARVQIRKKKSLSEL